MVRFLIKVIIIDINNYRAKIYKKKTQSAFWIFTQKDE